MYYTYYYDNIKYITDNIFIIDWGQLHRDDDKPAFIGSIGQIWFKNGVRHRDGNNPTIIYTDGSRLWVKNDKVYYEFQLNKLLFIQFFIKFLFHLKYNRIVWSPNNLAGKFTKKQLFLLCK